MVLITEIRQVRSFCCIVLGSGEQYWLRREDMPSAGFSEGTEYDLVDFMNRIRICQYPRALNHAVSMLARRACSKKEISDRLIRLRYTEDVAELVIYKLEKEKLINDADFCEQWIRFRLSRRIGPSVIRRELKIKGIPEDMISAALSKTDADEERNNAVSLARKAWKRTDSAEDMRKRRRKVIESLVRKGYDWDTARTACDEAENEAE